MSADSKHVYDVLGLTAATSYDTLPPTNLKDPHAPQVLQPRQQECVPQN